MPQTANTDGLVGFTDKLTISNPTEATHTRGRSSNLMDMGRNPLRRSLVPEARVERNSTAVGVEDLVERGASASKR